MNSLSATYNGKYHVESNNVYCILNMVISLYLTISKLMHYNMLDTSDNKFMYNWTFHQKAVDSNASIAYSIIRICVGD